MLGVNGSEGQGNPDPRSEFENHAIVKFGGKYYDPSYGTGPFDDDQAWENASLKAFGSLILYNKPILIGQGLFFRRYVNHKAELNTTAPQVIIIP